MTASKYVPDWDTAVETDYINKNLPPRVRAEVLSILRNGARRNLEAKITGGIKPHKLADGSLGWAQGMHWGPPFEGENWFPMFHIQVKAKRVKESEPPPLPPTYHELQAENARLRAELKKARNV